MLQVPITLAVEGDADVAVIRRILVHVGLEVGPIHGLRGKGWLNQQLRGYNNAARHAPWLVLRDLNSDAPCPSALLAALLPHPAPGMCLRIAGAPAQGGAADSTGRSFEKRQIETVEKLLRLGDPVVRIPSTGQETVSRIVLVE